jgi:hypothetical protein
VDVTLLITEIVVSVLPNDHELFDTYAITVAWRGNDQYAVVRRGQCLGVDGTWTYELRPSSRTDEWIAAHRFPYMEALRIARRAVLEVTVNGKTAADLLAEEAA